MKRNLFFILLPALFVTFAFQQSEVQDYCNSSAAKLACKRALSPFRYDAAKTTKITFKQKTQRKEFEVPLFAGERYKLVFNPQGLPQPINVKIYDRQSSSKKKELLFSIDEAGGDDVFEFIPKKSKTIYVTYEIPETTDNIKKGCMVLVMGFESKLK